MIDVTDSNAVYYYHFDGLGSVVALSDVNSVIVETYSYDVFGQPSNTSSYDNPYLFTGRRYDNETALYYYRARYYDYYLGRFLQTDPIGYATGLNMYGYVDDSPINFVDPYGLCSERIDRMEKYERLQQYLEQTAEAIKANIATVELLHSKKMFWHNYYQTIRIVDAATTAVSLCKAAVGLKRAGVAMLASKASWKAWRWVGYARAADAAVHHAKNANELAKSAIAGLGTDVGVGVVSAMPLFEINKILSIDEARHKLMTRNDREIQQVLKNIEALSQGAAGAFEEIRRLDYGN